MAHLNFWDVLGAPFAWPMWSFEALFTGTGGPSREAGQSYSYMGTGNIARIAQEITNVVRGRANSRSSADYSSNTVTQGWSLSSILFIVAIIILVVWVIKAKKRNQTKILISGNPDPYNQIS